MTELRTRPGEILDRVADGGESFLIERNGLRKACLVPMTVFLPDVSPSRIAEELDELKTNGENPRTTITINREIAFKFQHIVNEKELDLTIVLPHGYPNSCPRVYAEIDDERVPHRWADGALCIFGVMSAWNPGKHTVLSALNLARTWLQRYETWRKTNEWPKPGLENEHQ